MSCVNSFSSSGSDEVSTGFSMLSCRVGCNGSIGEVGIDTVDVLLPVDLSGVAGVISTWPCSVLGPGWGAALASYLTGEICSKSTVAWCISLSCSLCGVLCALAWGKLVTGEIGWENTSSSSLLW